MLFINLLTTGLYTPFVILEISDLPCEWLIYLNLAVKFGKQMNVGFVVTHLSHGSPGSFVRVQEMAQYLSRLDFPSTILTPFKEDVINITSTETCLIPNAMAKFGTSSISYKVAKRLSASPLTSLFFLSEGSISRMTRLIAKGMEEILRRRTFDVLHAIQPIASLACAPLARMLKIPIVTDLHNIWPEQVLLDTHISQDSPTIMRLRKIEQEIINSSDAITVTSDFMKEYILNEYRVPSDKRIIVVPPAGPSLEDPELAERTNNVVFAGLVDEADHVDLFARSIPLVKSGLSFYISNRGERVNEIKKITKQKGFPHVNYTWFNERHAVINFLRSAMIGILTERKDITRQLGPPLKMFDYMACGIPVVANDIGGWTSMIRTENIGILTEDSPADFARAINILAEDTELRNKFSRNAISLIKQKYSWEINVKDNLIPLYRELAT